MQLLKDKLRKLEMAGFKPGQLRALVPLVKPGIPAEEILKLFEKDSDESAIRVYKVNIDLKQVNKKPVLTLSAGVL